MQFKTTAAYVSGGICGRMWWPQAMAGKPIQKDLHGPWGIMDRFSEPASFYDALHHLLMEEGGDFQNAQFTADTIIRIERRAVDAPGKYRIHVKEITLDRVAPELVNDDAFVGDFLHDDD